MKVSQIVETFDELIGEPENTDEKLFILQKKRYKISQQLKVILKQLNKLLTDGKREKLVFNTQVDDDGEWDEEKPNRKYFHRIFIMPTPHPNNERYDQALHIPAFNVKNVQPFLGNVQTLLKQIEQLELVDGEIFQQYEDLETRKKAGTQ